MIIDNVENFDGRLFGGKMANAQAFYKKTLKRNNYQKKLKFH